MARVTLIRPAYSAEIYGNVYKQDKESLREIRPPLGLMALGGYLKKFGHQVVIIDGEPDLLNQDETVERALQSKPEFVGITSTTPEYPFAYGIIKKIKESNPDIVTVFGGAHITNLPDHTMADLDPYVDWGVVYEGEKPMAAVVNGNPQRYVWKADGNPKLLMARDRLDGDDLSSFTPDRTILDMSKYRYVDTHLGLVQNDALESARGCPFACVFCTSRRTLMATRSQESVLEEIVTSAEKYQTKMFMFFDDTFTLNKKLAIDMFNEIISLKKRGRLAPEVRFYGFTRANTLHDMTLLRTLRDAGCDKITLGIETGNAEILKATQKGTKLDDYRTAYAMMDELGIAKRGSFIIGHPYESPDTIRDSINFARELDLDEIGVNIMTPYPGQVTYRDALEARGIWFSHPLHYAELCQSGNLRDTWSDYLALDWHDYWRDHLRWGRSVVETETLSADALQYWHGRFLQEIYGSENMANRRQKQIDEGNNDDYWHRPWRVNAQRNRERIEQEKTQGMPEFALPMHQRYTYRPVALEDFQKNELYMTAGRKRQLKKQEETGDTQRRDAASEVPAIPA
jgi:radical SAM superfamily enzyme YgiQ (UPF0313 family)